MKGSKTKVSTAERRLEALDLRRQGASLREIAQALEISLSTAHSDISKSLKEMIREPAEQLLQLELERLDLMTLAVAPQVQKGHLGAIDRWLRIMDRRAKLLGLDKAPQQSIDVLTAFKILIDNGILPSQTVQLAGEELTRATTAIAQSISGEVAE